MGKCKLDSLIDAAMTQLKEEGWIHHLARHAVACFLTRGDLFISWEEGARVFDRDLIDAVGLLNNGNWMRLSASSFFYQYFRVYGPHSFAKYDKEGVCETFTSAQEHAFKIHLRTLDGARKYESRCIIGVDYPKPMVDHAVAETVHGLDERGARG